MVGETLVAHAMAGAEATGTVAAFTIADYRCSLQPWPRLVTRATMCGTQKVLKRWLRTSSECGMPIAKLEFGNCGLNPLRQRRCQEGGQNVRRQNGMLKEAGRY